MVRENLRPDADLNLRILPVEVFRHDTLFLAISGRDLRHASALDRGRILGGLLADLGGGVYLLPYTLETFGALASLFIMATLPLLGLVVSVLWAPETRRKFLH